MTRIGQDPGRSGRPQLTRFVVAAPGIRLMRAIAAMRMHRELMAQGAQELTVYDVPEGIFVEMRMAGCDRLSGLQLAHVVMGRAMGAAWGSMGTFEVVEGGVGR